MDATVTRDQHDGPARSGPGLLWRRAWPAALAVLVAAATAFRLTDGRDIASMVAASGLVYLAAAATGRRWAAWVAFAVTIPLITLDKLIGLGTTPWMLVLAAALLIVGVAGRRTRPGWALPLQTAAMIVLGATALIAIHADATIGGLLVAAALLGHAAWDIHHHRTGRVVDHSLAEFCAVLDILVAVFVAVVTLTA